MKRPIRRKFDPKRPVKVHRNLHTGGYSISQDGRVVLQTPALALERAYFIVSEKGRKRVLKNKRKHVHAWAVGYLEYTSKYVHAEALHKAGYNPYLSNKFYYFSRHKNKAGYKRCSMNIAKYATFGPNGMHVTNPDYFEVNNENIY